LCSARYVVVAFRSYDPAAVKTSSEDWQGYDRNVGGNSNTTYSLVDGKIRTGTEVGIYVSGEGRFNLKRATS
jgi:hypothetical protein